MTDKNKAAARPLTAAEQAKYASMAEKFEAGDLGVIEGAHVELTDPDKGAAIFDELEATIGPGRPALSGRAGAGESPKRQVRLPRDLDAALEERAATENRRPSAIMRDALAEYLSKKAS